MFATTSNILPQHAEERCIKMISGNSGWVSFLHLGGSSRFANVSTNDCKGLRVQPFV